MCDNCRMDSIVDSHFHIWDLALRRSYPYTDASFDWPGPQPATAAIHRDFTAAEVAAELGGSKVNNAPIPRKRAKGKDLMTQL